MTIKEIIRARKIMEVVHFTTENGLVGILDTGFVLSRHRLPKQKRLEHIMKLNCATRYDPHWLDFVNLSIGRINIDFFGASKSWHPPHDALWCILSFKPEIMTHKGVYFATTNNRYSGVVQSAGSEGLEAIYPARVHRYLSNYATRTPMHESWEPTCRQAEVLYPQQLSLDYLKAIYFPTEEECDTGVAQCQLYKIEVECKVQPEAFNGLRA
jgi:ssDNA thymidine ADP-ribosyltransferase, DarT